MNDLEDLIKQSEQWEIKEQERIDNTGWFDLKISEIPRISDAYKRYEYRKKTRNCVVLLVNKLLALLPSNFRFVTPNDDLTCRVMLQECVDHLKKQGYTKEEIIKGMETGELSKKSKNK